MKYVPYKWGRWWWAILDKATYMLVRKEDEKIVLFRSKEEAQAYCDEHNES